MVLALLFAANPEPARKAAQWVQVQVAKPAVPEPPKPPAPTPEPPKPKPKPVAFKDLQPTPPPEVAPTPAPRRIVQGLTANSFANSGSGLSVRAGDTTQIAAEGRGLTLDEAKAPRAWAAVATRPKMTFQPVFMAPDEARKANAEGTVQVRLDIDETGGVTQVKVLSPPLGYGIEEACVAAWRKAKFKPAMQDGAAVSVTGMPQYCVVAANP
ncbi:MAG: energy transducer TonB [Myxococcales bacterium]|nr:energy transducer TonB [Myxococcales bacterium]